MLYQNYLPVVTDIFLTVLSFQGDDNTLEGRSYLLQELYIE